MTQHGDQIALFDGEVDPLDGGRVGRRVVVQDTAEEELGGVDGVVVRGLEGQLLGLLGCEGADELGHEIGEAEDGQDEDEEGLFGWRWWDVGVIVSGGGGEALESSKRGGGKRGGVGGWRAASDFGKESTEPAEKGVDAENGA